MCVCKNPENLIKISRNLKKFKKSKKNQKIKKKKKIKKSWFDLHIEFMSCLGLVKMSFMLRIVSILPTCKLIQG
jgi:hypothetical protein